MINRYYSKTLLLIICVLMTNTSCADPLDKCKATVTILSSSDPDVRVKLGTEPGLKCTVDYKQNWPNGPDARELKFYAWESDIQASDHLDEMSDKALSGAFLKNSNLGEFYSSAIYLPHYQKIGCGALFKRGASIIRVMWHVAPTEPIKPAESCELASMPAPFHENLKALLGNL